MNVTCPNCATVYRVDPAKVPAAGVRARCSVCSAVFAVRREGDAEAAKSSPALRVETPRAAAPPQASAAPEPPRPVQPAASARPPSSTGAPAPAAPSGGPAGPSAVPRPAAPAAPSTPAGVATPAAPRPATANPAAAPNPLAGPPRPVTPGVGAVSPAAAKPPTPVAATGRPAAPSSPPAASPTPSKAPTGVPSGSRPTNPFLSQDPALKARRLARALISDMVVYHPGKRQEGLRDGNLKALFEDEIKKSWEEYAEQVGREVADSTPYFREALNEILAGGRQIF
jgi:predicted Zn finger-like uncharacterized protein